LRQKMLMPLSCSFLIFWFSLTFKFTTDSIPA
jgi:hypothetical protein